MRTKLHIMDPAKQSNPELRKRHLSECDPEMCEFMPLSKRINNLHLNSNNLSDKHKSSERPAFCNPCGCRMEPSTSSSVVQCSLCNPNLCGISRQVLPDLINMSNEKNSPSNQDFIYSPEMDDKSNPHYYAPNKLLFSLHIERVKRYQ